MKRRMEWRVALGLKRLASAFVLIAIGSIGTPCLAQTVNNVIYAEGYCDGVGDGTFSNPWKSASGTGCILESLNACAALAPSPTPLQDGCRIVLPQGFIKVTNTIDTSCDAMAGATCTSSAQQYGLVIEGHGSSTGYQNEQGAFPGTALVWAGSSAGTVLRVADTSFSVFQDFTVMGQIAVGSGPWSGSTKAAVGIEVTQTSQRIADKDVLRNIHLENFSVVGIRVGYDHTNQAGGLEIDSITIDSLTSRRSTVGAEQNGSQSTNVHWRNCAFEDFTDAGMDIWSPDIHVENCSFISSISPGSNPERRADVRVHSTDTSGTHWKPLWALFQGNVHETYYGSAYLFCDGTLCSDTAENGASHVEPTTFIDTRVLWWGPDNGKIIDYRHGGPLNLIGCNFSLSGDTGTELAYIDVNVPNVVYPAIHAATVTSLGNFYDRRDPIPQPPPNPDKIPGVFLRVQGDTSVLANDNATADAVPFNAKTTSVYRDNGIILDGGSLNWKRPGDTSPVKFKQYLDALSQLTLVNSGNTPIASWTDASELKFQMATGKLSFQSTSLVAARPDLAATVSIPAITGTAVVSNSTAARMICASTPVNPGVQNNGTTTPTTFTATGVAAGDVCTCTPSSDWNVLLVPKGCISGSGTLTLYMFSMKASGPGIDPPSTTVDYCCTRK